MASSATSGPQEQQVLRWLTSQPTSRVKHLAQAAVGLTPRQVLTRHAAKATGPRKVTLLRVLFKLASSRLVYVLKLLWLVRSSVTSVFRQVLEPVYTHPWVTALMTVLGAEGLFYLWFQRRYRRWTSATHDTEFSDGPQAFSRVLDFIQGFTGRPALAPKLRQYICTWFRGASWEELRVGNLEEHIAYSFFYKSPAAVRASGQGDLLQSMLDQLLSSCELHDVEPGHNSQVKAMWHLEEPLRVRFMPLTFYLAIEAVAGLTQLTLRCAGFKRGNADGCGYWYRGVDPARRLGAHTQPVSTAAVGPAESLVPDPQAPFSSLTQSPRPLSEGAATPKLSAPSNHSQPSSSGSLRGQLPAAKQPAPQKQVAVASGGKSAGNSPSKFRSVVSSAALQSPSGSSQVLQQQAAMSMGARTEAMDVSGSPLGREGKPPLSASAGVKGSRSCPTFQELVDCAEAATLAAQEADATQMQQQMQEQQAQSGGVVQPVPLVFLHGVGVGLLPYLMVWWKLMCAAQQSRAPLILMEFKHVSLRLCRRVPTADTAATSVVAALSQLGLTQACVIAHSYGTFVASRLVQMFPHRVKALVLIDPVCFGMFLPRLLYNFVYNQEVRRDSVWHWVKDLAIRFCSQDLHCAATFCRRFFWHQVQLDPAQLPPQSLVVVGGHDELLHGEEVATAIASVAAARQGRSLAPFPLSPLPDTGTSLTEAHPAATPRTSTDFVLASAPRTSETESLLPDKSTTHPKRLPLLAAYCPAASAQPEQPGTNTAGSSTDQLQLPTPTAQTLTTVLSVGGAPAGGVCQGPGTVLVYDPHMAHADFIFRPSVCVSVMDTVLEFVKRVGACEQECCAQPHVPPPSRRALVTPTESA